MKARRNLRVSLGLLGIVVAMVGLSFAAVPYILAEGGKAYENYGMGRSRGTLPFQLAGNIRHGGLFETAFGVTLGELIDDIGGGTASGRPVRAVREDW